MTAKKSKQITFGAMELPANEFEPKNVKVRVTTFLDKDVLLALKKLAQKRGDKYQTLLNAILRSHLIEQPPISRPKFEKLIRNIVRDELRRCG